MTLIPAIVLALAPAQIAPAQTPASQAPAVQALRPPRADVSGTLGWFSASKSELGSYNDWYNSSLYGGVAAGWYWNDHLKTEVDVGASTRAELHVVQPFPVGRAQAYRTSLFEFSTRQVAISQQYQFFRNAWFHPYVAAGAELTWETTRVRSDPVYVFDPVSGSTQVIDGPHTSGPETDLMIRPAASAGFKAYITPRAFFRSDLRLVFGGGVDEALLRAGFGIDF